jgi:hypothetical protein
VKRSCVGAGGVRTSTVLHNLRYLRRTYGSKLWSMGMPTPTLLIVAPNAEALAVPIGVL